jgi:putative nucleotidyltransferase with HDIG domain
LNIKASKSIGKDRPAAIQHGKDTLARLLGENRGFRWFLLASVTAVFVLTLYPNSTVPRADFEIGDIADRDIKAPRDFRFTDLAATEAKRRQVAEEVLTVYDYNTALLPELSARVHGSFDDLRNLIERPGALPVDAGPLSAAPEAGGAVAAEPERSLEERVWRKKDAFSSQLGIEVSKGAYSLLYEKGFDQEIPDLISQILAGVLQQGVVANKALLLKEAGRGIILRDVGTQEEQRIKDLRPFYGFDQAQSMIRIDGQQMLRGYSYNLRNLIIDFSQQLVQPNITLNRNETEERKRKAADQVEPVLMTIKSGEMLLREGERITENQLSKLNALQAQLEPGGRIHSVIGAALLLICLLVGCFKLCEARIGRNMRQQNRALLLMAILLTALLLVAQSSLLLVDLLSAKRGSEIVARSLIYGLPLASGPMIICLCLGWELALAFAVVLAVCSGITFQSDLTLFLYFLMNGSLAAYWIRDCRERTVFVKAGTKLGIVNMVIVTSIHIFNGESAGLGLPWHWMFAFLGGIGSGIVAAGIVPLAEIAFDFTTDIKLLELANLERPILKRLLLEAPGTYHHSVVVGSMVEAAASEIGANPLLAKVCGYYHDIGKLKKPLYFIENQSDGKNLHDRLAPSMSSLILVAHVKTGVEIAREDRLGQPIIDTIQQHHGTSLITYFYDKARQQKGDEAVNIDDFRYPGPRPQSRETALVMLADQVEAAARSISHPTPSRIRGLVQNLINKIFSDGQLDHCELTLKDLHEIAKSFTKILTAMYHHRIEYPENRPDDREKGENGSPDRQQTKVLQRVKSENSEERPGHLRRLGQS